MSKNLVWKKVKERKYRAGYRKMINKTFILLNGREENYDIKDEGKTVSIFALTPDNKVVLVRVFRPGPELVLTEMPGGFVEEGEDPLKAGERELLEETGYSGEFELAGKVVDDAYSNCLRHCIVVKNALKVSEPKLVEDDEECEIVLMPIKDFREHLRGGNLTDVESGYIALDHLNLL